MLLLLLSPDVCDPVRVVSKFVGVEVCDVDVFAPDADCI